MKTVRKGGWPTNAHEWPRIRRPLAHARSYLADFPPFKPGKAADTVIGMNLWHRCLAFVKIRVDSWAEGLGLEQNRRSNRIGDASTESMRMRPRSEREVAHECTRMATNPEAARSRSQLLGRFPSIQAREGGRHRHWDEPLAQVSGIREDSCGFVGRRLGPGAESAKQSDWRCLDGKHENATAVREGGRPRMHTNGHESGGRSLTLAATWPISLHSSPGRRQTPSLG